MHYFRNLIKSNLGFMLSKIPVVRKSIEGSLTVFAFHDVSNNPSEFSKEFGLCVSPDTFKLQCQWIKLNFNVVHPADFINGMALPRNAAMLSFDDGFLGSFENGLEILEQLELPSISFLNMGSIINKTPMISAMACYLVRFNKSFPEYAKKNGLKSPIHLSLYPSALSKFQEEYGLIDFNLVTKYQGLLADINIVKKWDKSPLVCYGNHLFEHWNAIALNKKEFQEQYNKNEIILRNFKSYVHLFAFTNGQPNSCFNNETIINLKELGVGNVFSCFNGVNRNYKDKFLLGRISLGPNDNSSNRLWFSLTRALMQNKNSTLIK